MKRLCGLIFLLNGLIAFSQPVHLNAFNFDHFTVREKNISPELLNLTSEQYRNHPDFGLKPFEGPPCSDCFELLDRRDATSRYFVKANTNASKFYIQKASGPINYIDANGDWREINYRLEKIGDKLFVASHQQNPVTIDLENKIITLQKSDYKIQSGIPELIRRDVNGTETSLGAGNYNDYTAGDDGIIIHNFYPGIDLIFSLRQEEIETKFILNQKLPYNAGEIILRQQIDLPKQFSFNSESNQQNLHREIYVQDQNHVPYFVLEKGFAFSGTNSSAPYSIKSSIKNNKYLEYVIPLSWLNDVNTVYPVTIDPTIRTQNSLPIVGIAGTKFSPVCWTNSCDYFMGLATPAGVSLTAIYHSFEFYATGLCFADDGGYSIDYNACHAPAGAPGVFTNPVHISNAYLTADTVLLPEFNACLPAPQCSSLTLNFTLHFFRCNNDPDVNCTGNCIRATKPWTIFLEGNTLELTNISPNQQICQGGNAQITAKARYGIPPYTFFWSPGGATNDTISVSPSTSTTYTVIVTDACGTTSSATSTVDITANTNPGFTISSTPVCVNVPVTLNGTGGGNPSDYDWIVNGSNAPGGIINDNISPSVTYTSPGNYDVILKYPNNGCSFNDTVPITVSPIISAAVSVTANPSSSICQGDTIVFKAVPVNGGLTPTYDWLVDGILVQSNSSDSLVASSFINGSNVNVILHTSSPCVSSLTDTATIVVTINSALIPVVTISPDTAVCPGSPVTLNATPINGGATPSYQWYANGVPVSGATSSSYSFNVTPPDTIISVQLSSSLSCVTTSSTFDTSVLNILRNLVTSVNVTSAPSGMVCAGDTVVYSAHTQNGGPSPQFQWYVNSVLTSATDSVFSTTPNNNDLISVQLISSLSCVINNTISSNIITNVSPSVSPSVSVLTSPSSTICKGDSITFTANTLNAGSTPVYSWFVNGSSVGTNDSIFTTTSLNNNDVVSVILTSSLSCAPILTDTDFVSVTVVGNVVPSVSISTIGSASCVGDTIQFVANALNGGPAAAFQWFVNGVNIGLNSDTIKLTTLQTGDSVEVILTSSLGCVTPANVTSPVYVSALLPMSIPQIDIVATPADTICIGQKVIINSIIQNGGNSPDISWFVNSILQPVTTPTFTSSTFGIGDVIVATVFSNANCLLQYIDTSNFIRIVFHQPLSVDLTSTNPECPGNAATITAHVSGGNGGPYHLMWSNGEVDVDSIIIIPAKNTKITVQADDNCTIKSASTTFTVPVLSAPEADFAYINPSPGSFQNNIQFINLSVDADSWLWTFPESNTTSTELNPLHQFPKQGTYEVILITRNNDGCVDSVKYNVSVMEEIAVFYPNSFSPNGDGKNDIFQPLGASLEDYEMTIWNRWGEKIYEGNNKSSWNGMVMNGSKPAPEGVYVFRIDLMSDKFEKRVVTGKVTLIR